MNFKAVYFQLDGLSSYNKVLLKFSKEYWFEMIAQHRETMSPYNLNGLASFSYNNREIKAGFNISEPRINDKSYNGEVFFQWHKGAEARTQFYIGRGNSYKIDYNFSSNTTISGYQDLSLRGQLLMNNDESDVNFGGNYGGQKYGAVFRYRQGEEAQFTGTVMINNEEYYGKIGINSKDEKRSITVDLEGVKHIQFIASYNNDLTLLDLELFWDKNVDNTKCAIFKTVFVNRSISAEMRFMQQSGKFVGNYSPTSIFGQLHWGEYSSEVEGRLQLSMSKVELMASLKSSFDLLSDVRAHVLLGSERDISGRTLISKVKNTLNTFSTNIIGVLFLFFPTTITFYMSKVQVTF